MSRDAIGFLGRIVLVGGVLLAGVVVGCKKEEPPKGGNAGNNNSPAGTQSTAMDLSTPQIAAMSFAKAVDAGDVAAAKSCAVGDRSDQFVQGLVDGEVGLKKLQDATTKKFGAEKGKLRSYNNPSMVSQLDGAVVSEEGDYTTFTPKDSEDHQTPITFMKVGAQWKFDTDALSKDISSDPDTALKRVQAEAKAAAETAAEVDAGKYASVADAETAFGRKITTATMAGMSWMRNGDTTAPSTSPSTHPTSGP